MTATTPQFAVDEDLCVGHGRCYRLAPQAFTADDMGLAHVRDVQDGDLTRDPQDIVHACPEGAVSHTNAVEETQP